MKTKLIASVLLAASVLAVAQPALALDISKLHVKVSDAINKDCMQEDGHDAIWACFVPRDTIYIRAGLPSQLLPYALLTNVGQYVIMNYSNEELEKVFSPVAGLGLRRGIGNTFAFWVLGGTITPAEHDFFRSALMK